MADELFAGISVADLARALAWYEQLLGGPPSFRPNDTEAVWQVGDHAYVYVELRPEHSGHALIAIIVDDLDDRVAAISERGIEPVGREAYDNGVRKVTYRDPEGNVLAFGGGPQ